ncbi:chitin deacetylase 7-like isoform X3 [Haemaphysalis longicornis]
MPSVQTAVFCATTSPHLPALSDPCDYIYSHHLDQAFSGLHGSSSCRKDDMPHFCVSQAKAAPTVAVTSLGRKSTGAWLGTMAVASAGVLYLVGMCFAAGATVRAKCDRNKCRPEENCLCVSSQPPGNLGVEEMPQFVMLTFDDAVNEENMDFYRHLLAPGRRKNRANGCNMVATFFVSAVYTDYSFVHELYSAGNEIALHSITHVKNYTYWRTLDVAGWEAEFLGEREILRDYALIPERDMVGARAPFLESGRGASHVMMQEHGFLYDSSVHVNYTHEPDKLPVYPYTLDYGLQTKCIVPPCPEGTYKGLWTVPLNWYYRTVQDDAGSPAEDDCPMADACHPHPVTHADTFDFLRSNFELFYHYNRAPFPIFIHEDWLHEPERAKGFLTFVDWLLTMDDVFFVTVEEVVRFMQNPRPLGEYVQSKCSKATEFSRCPEIHSCEFADAQSERTRWLRSCRRCPNRYPWIREVARTKSERDRSVDPATLKQLHYNNAFVFLFGSVLVFYTCIFAYRLAVSFRTKHGASFYSKLSMD